MSMSLSHNKTVTKPYVLIWCHFTMIIHLCHFIIIIYLIIRLWYFIIITHLCDFIEVIECIAVAKRHLQQTIDDHKELTVNSLVTDGGKQGVEPATLGLRQSWREESREWCPQHWDCDSPG